jgi:hypothetical protein
MWFLAGHCFPPTSQLDGGGLQIFGGQLAVSVAECITICGGPGEFAQGPPQTTIFLPVASLVASITDVYHHAQLID